MKRTIRLTESELKGLIESVINEMQTKIDNFDRAAKYLEYKNPDDDYYFVQITKRRKDNPHDDKTEGNYRNGSWYLKSWRISSAEQLMQLKPEIIDLCEKNNARAYMCVNARSHKATDERVKFIKQQKPWADHVEDRVAGEAKDGPNWKGQRLRLVIDIDTDNRKIWNEVHYILEMCHITIFDEYETPSGGLHIIIPNKEEKNFEYAKILFRKFDNFRDVGRNATVHPNPDAKMILYSNTDTKGY